MSAKVSDKHASCVLETQAAVHIPLLPLLEKPGSCEVQVAFQCGPVTHTELNSLILSQHTSSKAEAVGDAARE